MIAIDVAMLLFTCFDGDTLVATEEGQKRIDEIEAGDRVWAYNVKTGKLELKEVLTVYVKENDEILHLKTTEGDIDTTTNHPFYVISKGWVAAGDLEIGDEILTIDGEIGYVLSFELETLDAPIPVYNIEVDDFHTYFVGDGNGWILVHNQYGSADNAGKHKDYVQNGAYNDLRNKLGQKGVNQFIDAMRKGIIGPNGQAGIKQLSPAVNIGGELYKYEVKVFGEFANYRLYGNYVKELGVIVFTQFGKALH